MKADITIPKPIYKAAEQLAQNLRISLSDLCTAALSAYVMSHRDGDVTEALNRVYEMESSTLDPVLVRLQLASVGDETW